MTEGFIQQLYSIILKHGAGRKPEKSKYRGAMPPGVLFAVYDNQTKQLEYIPSEHSDVKRLMNSLR